MNGPDFIKQMKDFAASVERVAFDIDPPNQHTPQLVQLAQAARHIIGQHEQYNKKRFRQLMRNMRETHPN